MSDDYEYVDESSIDKNLKCSICNEPFIKPYTTSCDHIFCFECIEKQILINRSCPICRQTLENTNAVEPVKTRLVLNMLDSLLVTCKICHSANIERGLFNDHLKQCTKQSKQPCTAADIRCVWTGDAEQVAAHVKECPYEQIRPVLTDILSENYSLKEQVKEIVDHLEHEMKKMAATKELEERYLQLKDNYTELYQKYQQLQNEKYAGRGNPALGQDASGLSSLVEPITFEYLLQYGKLGSVPSGYAGFVWMNARYTNEENARAIRSLGDPNRISVFSRGCACIIYNDWKNPMVISTNNRSFKFHGCEIMSLNFTEKISKLSITARQNRKSIYSKTALLQHNVSKAIEVESWSNIDEIEFSIPNTYFIMTWIQLE